VARFVVTKWNAEKLVRRPARILVEYGPKIAFQTQQEISKDQFPWPVTTRRKNGRIVEGGPGKLRDIVDTGTLLNSQTPPLVTNEGSLSVLRIRWDAPYSGDVLRGGYLVGTLRNNYVAPERDWITPALREQPLLPFFRQRWAQIAQGNAGRE
jgi:hypothetical protein